MLHCSWWEYRTVSCEGVTHGAKEGGALIDLAYRFENLDFARRFGTIDLLIDFGDMILRYRFAYRFPRYDSAL